MVLMLKFYLVSKVWHYFCTLAENFLKKKKKTMLDESFLEHSFEDSVAEEKKKSSYLSLKKNNNMNLFASAFIDMIGFAYWKKD